MSIDVKSMTDDELNGALSAISVEISDRKSLADIPKKMEVLNRDYLAAAGVADGAAWVQPAGAHDAYPEGWKVKHGGKTWVSLTPANVWQPGISGWREQAPASAPGAPAAHPAWAQPTGAHDAYAAGAVVAYGGKVWKSTAAGNVWQPGVYGWVPA